MSDVYHKRGIVVIVFWLDSVGLHGWRASDREELKVLIPGNAKTTGTVLKHDANGIVVAGSILDAGTDNEQVDGVMCIPAGVITNIVPIG